MNVARRRRHRREIAIWVVDRNDVLRFLAYDVVLSSALYAGLRRCQLADWIPWAASMVVPTALRKALHRNPRRPPPMLLLRRIPPVDEQA